MIREFSAVYVSIMVLTVFCWEILSQSILSRIHQPVHCGKWVDAMLNCCALNFSRANIRIRDLSYQSVSPILSVIPLPSPPSVPVYDKYNACKRCNYHHSIVPFRAINYFSSFLIKRKRRNNKRTGKLLVGGNLFNLTHKI